MTVEAHSHWAKTEEKAKISFHVCLFFHPLRFRLRFRLVWTNPLTLNGPCPRYLRISLRGVTVSRLVPCNMRCVLISHIEIRPRLVPGGKVYVEVHFMILALWETLNQNVREGERVGGFMCVLNWSWVCLYCFFLAEVIYFRKIRKVCCFVKPKRKKKSDGYAKWACPWKLLFSFGFHYSTNFCQLSLEIVCKNMKYFFYIIFFALMIFGMFFSR